MVTGDCAVVAAHVTMQGEAIFGDGHLLTWSSPIHSTGLPRGWKVLAPILRPLLYRSTFPKRASSSPSSTLKGLH